MTCPDCEELRSRAEWAESRIASVSGVTREELAKREFERGAAAQREADEKHARSAKYALTGGPESRAGIFNAGVDHAADVVRRTPMVTP